MNGEQSASVVLNLNLSLNLLLVACGLLCRDTGGGTIEIGRQLRQLVYTGRIELGLRQA